MFSPSEVRERIWQLCLLGGPMYLLACGVKAGGMLGPAILLVGVACFLAGMAEERVRREVVFEKAAKVSKDANDLLAYADEQAALALDQLADADRHVAKAEQQLREAEEKNELSVKNLNEATDILRDAETKGRQAEQSLQSARRILRDAENTDESGSV